jgi:hypothetical protein
MRRAVAIMAVLAVLLGLAWSFGAGPPDVEPAHDRRVEEPDVREVVLEGARSEPRRSGRTQDPASSAAQDEPREFSARVVVRDGERRPVAGARLAVPGHAAVESDADGAGVIRWSGTFAYVETTARGFVPSIDGIATTDGGTLEILLTRGAVLRGRVVEARTRRPVAGARIVTGQEGHADGELEPPWYQQATADESGRFRLDSLGRQDTRLWVEARGWSRARATFEVSDDGRVEPDDVTLEVEPAGWLSARVTRSDGTAAAGAIVILEPEGGPPSDPGAFIDAWVRHHRWFDTATVLGDTDEHGEASIYGLAFGTRYGVRICDKVQADAASPALILATPASPEVRLERHLRATATLNLHCTGIDSDAVGSLSIELDGEEAPTGDVIGGSTRVTTGIVPGRHSVVARARDRAPITFDAVFDEGAVVDRRITFEPGLSVSGIVVDDRGAGVERARVTLGSGSEERGLGWSDASGAFRIGGLPAGACEAMVEGPGYDWSYMPLTTNIDVPAQDVRLVLRAKPVVTARFSAIEAGRLPGPLKPFVWVGGAPSGRQPVVGAVVRWRLDHEEARVGVVATGLALWERDVRVQAGAVLDLGDVVLEAGRRLEGQVVDPEDHPVADVEVNLDHLFGPGTRSGSDGRFVLEHIPRDPVWLRVSAKDYLRELVAADARASAQPIRISLRRGALVRIAVRTADGGPGLGYEVRVNAATDLPEPNSAWEVTDELGGCQARLSPGTYRVSVLRRDGLETQVAQTTVTLAEGTETDAEIRLP